MVSSNDYVQERDIGILVDIAAMRYLTSAQISRLWFGHLKLAQRRLRRLWQLGLVDRFRAAAGPALGDRRWIYRITPRGAALVAKRQGSDERALRSPERVPASVGYFEHHEELTDMSIWLREACEASNGVFTHELIPAYEETRIGGRRRRLIGVKVGKARALLVPDVVASLCHRDGRADLLVVEIDRGTQPLHRKKGTSVERKLLLFARAFDEGLAAYQELLGHDFPGGRMLWIVPSQQRTTAIKELAEKLHLDPLIWITTTEETLHPGRLGNPIWTVAGRDERHPLVGRKMGGKR